MAPTLEQPTGLGPDKKASNVNMAAAPAESELPTSTDSPECGREYYGSAEKSQHGQPELLDRSNGATASESSGTKGQPVVETPRKRQWLQYMRTKEFWIVLFLG